MIELIFIGIILFWDYMNSSAFIGVLTSKIEKNDDLGCFLFILNINLITTI